MIVQIYEIQTPGEAERCIELGVDHLGSVILDEDNWRVPSVREVINLVRQSGAKSSLIPLFRKEEAVCRVMDYYSPDFVHLCDNLTDQHGNAVGLGKIIRLQGIFKTKFPEILIIRSIPVPTTSKSHMFPTLQLACELEPVSDVFLVDTWTGKEPVAGFIGITGKPIDWSLAGQLTGQSNIPVILAGGLSPENVYEALFRVRPYGADSCTQTNKLDENGKPIRFKKDFDRVGRFIKEVRRAEMALEEISGGVERKNS